MDTNKIKTVDKSKYNPLDLKKLHDEYVLTISTKDALKDVTPINWDDEVVNGRKSVLLIDKN